MIFTIETSAHFTTACWKLFTIVSFELRNAQCTQRLPSGMTPFLTLKKRKKENRNQNANKLTMN